jgi:hypothetical protein
MCCCLVFVAHPEADPEEPSALALLALALASRRAVLLCVNGPRRAAASAGPGGADALAARWRAAVDALAAREGLDAGLCGVVLSEVQRGAGDEGAGDAAVAPGGGAGRAGGAGGDAAAGGGGAAGGEGVRGYRDVEEWVKREAAAFYRMV